MSLRGSFKGRSLGFMSFGFRFFLGGLDGFGLSGFRA